MLRARRSVVMRMQRDDSRLERAREASLYVMYVICGDGRRVGEATRCSVNRLGIEVTSSSATVLCTAHRLRPTMSHTEIAVRTMIALYIALEGESSRRTRKPR